MNLLDALKTIESHIRPGVTIECWMLSNGQMMRKVSFNDGDSFAASNAEWEAAIKAVGALSQMPTTVEDFGDKYPQAFVNLEECPPMLVATVHLRQAMQIGKQPESVEGGHP